MISIEIEGSTIQENTKREKSQRPSIRQELIALGRLKVAIGKRESREVKKGDNSC